MATYSEQAERTDAQNEQAARTDAHDARQAGSVGPRAPAPSPRLDADGTPVAVESNRDVCVSTTPPSPLPALQAEGTLLIATAAVAAMRSPEFIAALERAARLDTLAFLNSVSKYFATRDSSPSVVLNNIITSIPRGPLDALPEGFRRN